MSNITGSSNVSCGKYDEKYNRKYENEQDFISCISCGKKLDLNQNVIYEIRGGLGNKKQGNVCPDCYKKVKSLAEKAVRAKMEM